MASQKEEFSYHLWQGSHSRHGKVDWGIIQLMLPKMEEMFEKLCTKMKDIIKKEFRKQRILRI